MPLSHLYAPLRLTIKTSALQDNYTRLKSIGGETCQTAAVVKANAYGLGVDEVVPALEQAGARFFYVAHFSEALAVRALTACPIAVLGGLPHGAAADFIHHKIIPVLNSPDDIAALAVDLVVRDEHGMYLKSAERGLDVGHVLRELPPLLLVHLLAVRDLTFDR